MSEQNPINLINQELKFDQENSHNNIVDLKNLKKIAEDKKTKSTIKNIRNIGKNNYLDFGNVYTRMENALNSIFEEYNQNNSLIYDGWNPTNNENDYSSEITPDKDFNEETLNFECDEEDLEDFDDYEVNNIEKRDLVIDQNFWTLFTLGKERSAEQEIEFNLLEFYYNSMIINENLKDGKNNILCLKSENR